MSNINCMQIIKKNIAWKIINSQIIALCVWHDKKIPQTKSYGVSATALGLSFDSYSTPRITCHDVFFHTCLFFAPFFRSPSLIVICVFSGFPSTPVTEVFFASILPSQPLFAFSFVQLLCTFLASNLVRLWCSIKLFSPYLSVLLSSLHRESHLKKCIIISDCVRISLCMYI